MSRYNRDKARGKPAQNRKPSQVENTRVYEGSLGRFRKHTSDLSSDIQSISSSLLQTVYNRDGMGRLNTALASPPTTIHSNNLLNTIDKGGSSSESDFLSVSPALQKVLDAKKKK